MNAATSRKTLPDHQEALLKLISSNIPVSNIQIILGMNERTVRREIARLCKEFDLDYAPPAEGGRGVFIPRTEPSTTRLRVALYNWLTSFREAFTPQLTDRELAIATGMNVRAVRHAMNRPYTHDWTLTEISRAAASMGMTLETLLEDCLTRAPSSLPKLAGKTLLRPRILEI